MTDRNPDLLPVLTIIRDAFVVPWRKRAVMLRALLPVSVVLIALTTILCILLKQPKGLANLVFVCASFVLLSVVLTEFTVTCHRVILLGDDAEPKRGLITWSGRETRFVGWVMLGVFSWIAMYVTILIPVMGLLGLSRLTQTASVIICLLLAMLPCDYVIARFSILLPATAVDERRSLAWAWKTTEENGWRLFVVVTLLPIAFGCALSFLRGQNLFLVLAGNAVWCVLLAVEVAAISLSFRHLVARGTRPVAKPQTLGSLFGGAGGVAVHDPSPSS